MLLSDSAKIGLWGSIGAHLLFLICANGVDQESVIGRSFVRISSETLEAIVSERDGALSLGTFVSASGSEEQKLAQHRRQVYLEYLEAISNEIHSRRLDFGRIDLIGIVTYNFTVDANGRFSKIELIKTSGRPDLDAVARRAIESSSARVKRPKILGTDPMVVVQEVRFQYGLR